MSKIVIFYQPHQNIRQHTKEVQEGYKTCFQGCDIVYWLPTFLSRENTELNILSPQNLIEICISGGFYNTLQSTVENTDSSFQEFFQQDTKQSVFSKKNKSQNLNQGLGGKIIDEQREDTKKPITFVTQSNFQEVLENIKKHTLDGDLVIGMGAGDIDSLIRQAYLEIKSFEIKK
jgi:UDP-N-acetylmuramate-alanine ligase